MLRSAALLFEALSQRSGTTRPTVTVSFLEVYNDRVHDLLVAPNAAVGASPRSLALREAAAGGVVMEGLSFPTGMITSPGVLGNTPENDAPYAFDAVKAKALMEEAGYPDGFSVQLDCPNNRYNNDEKICQAVVGMLAKIGVDVKLDAIPKAQHFPKIQNRESDFYMLGWGVPTLDSHYVFSYLIAGDGSWNATGYSNDRVNEITKAIETETDTIFYVIDRSGSMRGRRCAHGARLPREQRQMPRGRP